MTTTTTVTERTPYGDVAAAWIGGERRARRVSWGAIFAGALVALAVWVLLNAVGLAVGLSSVAPGDLESARTAGIGTAIYSIVAPLIALFFGGVVASRLAGSGTGADGALHGVVVWALTTIAGLLFIGMVVQNIVGGVLVLGKTAMGAATDAAGTVASAPRDDGGGALAALGLDYDTLLAPANQRLAAEGMPAVSAEQLKAAVQDALPQMIAAREFDRQALLNAIAANTALSTAEAQEVAASVEQRFTAARERFGAQAKETALAAADTTGKAFWAIAIALALGLAAAAAGGATGTPGKRRRQRRDIIVTEPATVAG